MKKDNVRISDSSVVCHIGLSGKRKHTSIRCDEAIWEAFKQLCRANGLSTCDILEKLLIGFTIGLQTRVAQPTTIYVVVDAPRVVKRVRRRQLVYQDEVKEEVVNTRNEPRCFCGKIPAVGRYKHLSSGIEKDVCGYHSKQLSKRPDWKVLDEMV